MTYYNIMESITLLVNDYITLNKGVTPDEGEPIFKKLYESFSEGTKVILDFSGVEMMTTAFLNVAIGNLYKLYSSEQIKELLELKGLTTMGARQIKKVTDTAKLFYGDEEKFNQEVDEVLHGSN